MDKKTINLMVALGNEGGLDTLVRAVRTVINNSKTLQVNKTNATTHRADIDNTVAKNEYDVLICSESLKSSSGKDSVGVGSIRKWMERNPTLRIILVLSDSKRGGMKAKSLYDGGYYDALFTADLQKNRELLAYLIENGRTPEEAYQYYGLTSAEEEADDMDSVGDLFPNAFSPEEEEQHVQQMGSEYSIQPEQMRSPAAEPVRRSVHEPSGGYPGMKSASQSFDRASGSAMQNYGNTTPPIHNQMGQGSYPNRAYVPNAFDQGNSGINVNTHEQFERSFGSPQPEPVQNEGSLFDQEMDMGFGMSAEENSTDYDGGFGGMGSTDMRANDEYANEVHGGGGRPFNEPNIHMSSYQAPVSNSFFTPSILPHDGFISAVLSDKMIVVECPSGGFSMENMVGKKIHLLTPNS